MYLYWKRYDEGIKYGRKAIELIKEPPEDLATAYNSLGQCLSNKGQHAEAVQMIQQAAGLQPQNPTFQANLQAAKQKH